MKSSDFERLGDWHRTQKWGFEDAVSDLANHILYDRKIPSTCISTDRSSLQRKKRRNKTWILFIELIGIKRAFK